MSILSSEKEIRYQLSKVVNILLFGLSISLLCNIFGSLTLNMKLQLLCLRKNNSIKNVFYFILYLLHTIDRGLKEHIVQCLPMYFIVYTYTFITICIHKTF